MPKVPPDRRRADSPHPEADRPVRLDRLVEVMHAGFTALAGAGSILCLDWQHPSFRLWPSLVGPENIDPPGQPGWPLSPFPDGDYYIYLAEDFRFGTFGHPWELSLCVFGDDLLDLVEADLHDVLGKVMRRDGRQMGACARSRLMRPRG
ncbi:DUF2716 domain-containing protein [Micromonospora sp. DPT]|uniref:DUF2716 domain-containing protein n=1 Tax=Micromonospora sp. DPT TaxID=3142975 RepID=UPI00320AADBF